MSNKVYQLRVQQDGSDVSEIIGYLGSKDSILLLAAVDDYLVETRDINENLSIVNQGVLRTDDNLSVRFWDQRDRGYTAWVADHEMISEQTRLGQLPLWRLPDANS